MFQMTVVFLPDELLLGIPEIDAQHEEFFAGLASLKQRCLETNQFPSEAVHALLARLREHFAKEEQLACAASLPFSEHARKHEEVLSILDAALDSLPAGGKDIFGWLRYMDYWFERHIPNADRHSFAPLAGQAIPDRSSALPDQASCRPRTPNLGNVVAIC